MQLKIVICLASLLTATSALRIDRDALAAQQRRAEPPATAPAPGPPGCAMTPTPVSASGPASMPATSEAPKGSPPTMPNYSIGTGDGKAGCVATMSISETSGQIQADCSALRSQWAATTTMHVQLDCGACHTLSQVPFVHGCPMIPADKTSVEGTRTVMAFGCAGAAATATATKAA